MQVVINAPDNLPQARVEQVIKEVEERLREEARLMSDSDEISESRQQVKHDFVKQYRENPISISEMPSREERNAK